MRDLDPAEKDPRMFASLLEAIEDNSWHILREGLVVVCLETQRSVEDFSPEQTESKRKNRRALDEGSFKQLGDESFLVDLKERGINADQLADEIKVHLEPRDKCWFLSSTTQGAVIRKIA